MNVDSDVLRPLRAYFTCLQFGDFAGLNDVFTADAIGNWGPQGEVHLVGIEAITVHLSTVAALTSVTFAPSPAMIDANGERARARLRVVAHLTDDETLTLACAEYSDELQASPDGWRISRRDHHELWRAAMPLTALHPSLARTGTNG